MRSAGHKPRQEVPKNETTVTCADRLTLLLCLTACSQAENQNNPAARYAITGTPEHPEDYEVAFLGYTIWWGQAPKVLYTFLESYDFGYTAIVPFCTSGSSGIGSSTDGLQELTKNARWLNGQRFGAGTGEDEIAQWVDGLGLGL